MRSIFTTITSSVFSDFGQFGHLKPSFCDLVLVAMGLWNSESVLYLLKVYSAIHTSGMLKYWCGGPDYKMCDTHVIETNLSIFQQQQQQIAG